LPDEDDHAGRGWGLRWRINHTKSDQPWAVGAAGRGVLPPLSIKPTHWSGKGWVTTSAVWPRPYHAYYLSNSMPDWVHGWLSDLIKSSGQYFAASSWQLLDSFPGRFLWPLLAEARRQGFSFVADDPEQTVRLVDEMSLDLDIRQTEDGLTLQRRLMADGQLMAPHLIGAISHHGLFALTESDDGPTIILGPTPHPLDDAELELLHLGTIKVAADQQSEFLASAYHSLRRRLAVVSSDQSIELPQAPRPVMVIDVRYPNVRQADLIWSWDYQGQLYPLPFFFEDIRDHDAEQQILIIVKECLTAIKAPFIINQPSVGHGGVVRLGAALDSLADLPDVRVVADSDRPSYHLSQIAPTITARVDRSDDPDWFDLGLSISVGDQPVSLIHLFRAIMMGDEQLILDDGSIIRTDLPAFESLRQLIDEARRLTDGDHIRLNRYSVALWGEIEDLADHVEQVDDWRDSVGQLAHLTNQANWPAAASVPSDLKATLRPYQLTGYQWLAFLQAHGLGGVLADDMGLGKTIEVLALLAHVLQLQEQHRPFLVLAPASVVGNWATEAARFTPGIRTLALQATPTRQGVSLMGVADEVDLVVASYAVFRLAFDDFAALDWAGLIMDEAQFLKNANTKANQLARQLRTPFKLALTGTPLENNLNELWALMSVVAPGLFPSVKRFKEDYVKPINTAGLARQALAHPERYQGYTADDQIEDAALVEEGSALLQRLQRRLKPLMLRRTKEQVAPELPARIEQELAVELTAKHRRIYDTLLARERARVLGLLDDYQANRFEVFRSLMLLRRAALDPGLIDPRYADVGSAKLDVLFEQLTDVIAGGHRALIFSQFTSFLTLIGDRAKKEGLAFEYLDGRTRGRSRVIERFRSGDAPLFLISLKAGGFGLNLTEADYVFLMDPWWNPASENQAIDRTHRIGQDKPVMAIRLVATGTIEDKVMALKARKAQLFQAVLDDDSGAFAQNLGADDIRGLFED
jgi:hypothetical protein